MGFTGVIYITQSKGGVAFSEHDMTGYLQALACALIWSIYSVLSKKYSHRLTSDSVGGFCFATAILSWILHFSTEQTAVLSQNQYLALLVMGIGPVGLAFFVWDYGIRFGNVRTLGTLAYAGPLIGATLLFSLGMAKFTPELMIAGLLILGGAAIGCMGGSLFARFRNKQALDTSTTTAVGLDT